MFNKPELCELGFIAGFFSYRPSGQGATEVIRL